MSAAALVIKFGGTSLGTAARVRAAARRVAAHRAVGRTPVVVVSATGHTTDRILARLHSVAPGTAESTRETDRALACGEELSAALLAAALGALEVPARSLRGGEAGVLADGRFGAGRIARVHTDRIRSLLDAGVVPVVTGFQGQRTDAETVTLGRGGSDLSAVALAAALGRAPCHIVTDVPGVFDRDPREHSDARRLAALDYDELIRLVEGGAQVVHPGAAALARHRKVPLLVYHYRAPLSGRGGTRIREAARGETLEAVA